jgi:hypothetical protein
MVYKIYLDNNRKIELPNCYNLKERIELCEKIINENEEYFIYDIPVGKITANSACEKVKLRLMIMGEYIYDASSEGIDDSVVTQWRKHRNKCKEITFTDLERKEYE